MKRIFITIIAILISVSTLAQTLNVKDYFYKKGHEYPNAVGLYAPQGACASFYSSILNGSMEEYDEWALSDDRFTLFWKYQVRQESGYAWNTISRVKYELEYKEDAIYTTYQTYYNQFSPNGNYRHDKITLLALPQASGSRTWQETESGDKYSCSAQWAYITDGDSFCEQVIKISKKQVSSGITKASYWAKNYGKVWETWENKGEAPFTVKRRRGVARVWEISEEEFIKESSMIAFLKEHEGEKHSIAKDFPGMYKELKDNYAKYLIGLFTESFIYYVGPFDNFRTREKIDTGEDWRVFSLKYSTTIRIEDNGCVYDPPYVSSRDCTYEPIYDKKIKQIYLFNGDWASATVNRWTETNAFWRPYAVEPISGYKLFFPLEDQITQTLAISSYRLQIKRKKNEYLLKDGDASVWEVCKSALIPYLEEQYLRNKEKSISVRLIKFSSGQNFSFSLIKACKVYKSGFLECEIANVLTMEMSP